MSQPFGPRLTPALGVLLAAGVVIGAALALQRRSASDSNSPPPPPEGSPVGTVLSEGRLHQCAEAVGLTFRMNFLPTEQGENFKTNLYDHGCGVAIADYDGDGRDDLYFCNQLGPNALFRNRGDGTFDHVTQHAGVGLGDRICVGAAWADYDNDGDPDLFVTSTRGGNVLFQNNGDGTFTDGTQRAGLVLHKHSQTAAFFDYDNDGRLDLFVTNTAQWTTADRPPGAIHFAGGADLWDLTKAEREQNVLYRNNGDGTFTDVTNKAGVAGPGWGGDVAVFDYDDDGRLDLFVTNMFGRSTLYRNQGDGTFTDVTKTVLGQTSFGAIGCKVFDHDNDGRLDLLVVDMHSDMWMGPDDNPVRVAMILAGAQKKYSRMFGPAWGFEHAIPQEEAEARVMGLFRVERAAVLFGNTFYKNLGGGKFAERSDAAGLETLWPWGVATGDLDNDGFEDVYLPSGMGYPYFYVRSPLLMNNGNGTFTDRSQDLGTEPPAGGLYLDEKIGKRKAPRSARCAAVADFDGDGRLEIVTNNFNDRPWFFANRLDERPWIGFRLRGTTSNRDAVGAVVRLYAGSEVLTRQVQAAGGYLSQATRTLHFGLGSRVPERAEVRWPSGRTQTITRPTLNTVHAVTEPATSDAPAAARGEER